MEYVDTEMFEGDEAFEEQTAEAKRFEEMENNKKFIGYKLVNTCQNCFYQKDGDCHVLTKYGQSVLTVCDLGKCKQWKKRLDN